MTSKSQQQQQPGARTRARERVLQALYQIDVSRVASQEALDNAWSSADQPADAEGREYSERLLKGVQENREEVDGLIEKHSLHWKLERMAKVDRNVLRLAVFELAHFKDVPKRVVLNEAIELAKKFGSEESSAFINGILDKVAAVVRRGEG